jgi:hypothetical protein
VKLFIELMNVGRWVHDGNEGEVPQFSGVAPIFGPTLGIDPCSGHETQPVIHM